LTIIFGFMTGKVAASVIIYQPGYDILISFPFMIRAGTGTVLELLG
jgi:hypothetical protein